MQGTVVCTVCDLDLSILFRRYTAIFAYCIVLYCICCLHISGKFCPDLKNMHTAWRNRPTNDFEAGRHHNPMDIALVHCNYKLIAFCWTKNACISSRLPLDSNQNDAQSSPPWCSRAGTPVRTDRACYGRRRCSFKVKWTNAVIKKWVGEQIERWAQSQQRYNLVFDSNELSPLSQT